MCVCEGGGGGEGVRVCHDACMGFTVAQQCCISCTEGGGGGEGGDSVTRSE